MNLSLHLHLIFTSLTIQFAHGPVFVHNLIVWVSSMQIVEIAGLRKAEVALFVLLVLNGLLHLRLLPHVLRFGLGGETLKDC
jgi:hypothetical protein